MVENFAEEIEENIQTSFSVTNIPIKYLKEFKTFCKETCNNSYSTGIIHLLGIKTKYEEIIPFLSNLQKQIDELKENKSQRPRLKTFEGNNTQEVKHEQT
jgi:hypothetical protein